MNKNFFVFIFSLIIITSVSQANEINFGSDTWLEVKSTHFIVSYQSGDQQKAASEILRKAEEYYEVILDSIGANKVGNYWTWDDRVKIIYFRNQENFVRATGQPAWSKGVSLGHMSGFKTRLIASYSGQLDFQKDVLPHEISHLILHDFMGKVELPRWFDEGVAQLGESNNNDEHRLILARLVESNRAMPLKMLEAFPLMINEDPMKAAIFYAESLYIVDFLIKNYGKDKFGSLCRQLREGSSFEVAISKVYYPTIVSWKTLEEKWNQYMLSLVHI